MIKLAIAAMLLATAANATLPPVSAQIASIGAAVQVTATEDVQGLRSNYNLNSRGTVTIINNEVVVVTAGHSIDVSESGSRITRVSVEVGGQSYAATSWESRLGVSQDVGYIHFDSDVQSMLRPLAIPVSTVPIGAGETARLLYTNRGRTNTVVCDNVTSRRNMILQARGGGLHPSTRVNITADCRRTMGENSLSGSSLLNANGEIVGIFFADIEGQRSMNAAFSAI